MRIKRFIGLSALGMVLTLSGGLCSVSYASEAEEASTTYETDEGQSVESEETSNYDLGELEESDISVATIDTESEPLVFDKTIKYTFEEGIYQRKIYRIKIEKDSILNIKGKFYAIEGGNSNIMFLNSDFDEIKVNDNSRKISKDAGVVDYEYTLCFPKGTYYMLIYNQWGTFYSIGGKNKDLKTLSYDLYASVEYPKSSEIETNDTIKTAQSIDCKETVYGMLTYDGDDDIDTYRIVVDYKGKLKIDFSGRLLESDYYSIYTELLDAEGKRITSKGIKYDKQLETYKGTLEETVEPGVYYLQLSCIGAPREEAEKYYWFDVTLPSEFQPVGVKFAEYEGYTFYKDDFKDVRCYASDGKPVINDFKCDGTYTYYFQADGTAMKDRLTYHPDGVHVIYFDSEGHEVFSDFANVKKTIAGDEVDDFCFFDVFGYMYVDVVTYDKTGTVLYYANAYGVMEMGKWFQFSDNVTWADGREGDEFKGGYGCANADGTLITNTQTVDWEGRSCYLQGNGVALY